MEITLNDELKIALTPQPAWKGGNHVAVLQGKSQIWFATPDKIGKDDYRAGEKIGPYGLTLEILQGWTADESLAQAYKAAHQPAQAKIAPEKMATPALPAKTVSAAVENAPLKMIPSSQATFISDLEIPLVFTMEDGRNVKFCPLYSNPFEYKQMGWGINEKNAFDRNCEWAQAWLAVYPYIVQLKNNPHISFDCRLPNDYILAKIGEGYRDDLMQTPIVAPGISFEAAAQLAKEQNRPVLLGTDGWEGDGDTGWNTQKVCVLPNGKRSRGTVNYSY